MFMKKRANEYIEKKEKDPAFELRDRWPVVRRFCCLTVKVCHIVTVSGVKVSETAAET